MQNFKTVEQTFLGEIAHFGFCPPKIGFLRGLGGSPQINFFWNPNIFVTQDPIQNFKTVPQTLLGETAHFGLFPPKIGFFKGVGRAPKLNFYWNPPIFVT